MRIISIALAFLMFATVASNAQSLKRVSISYRYLAPLDMSVDIAKRQALEAAQAEAIAQEFGVAVSQSSFTTVEQGSDGSKEDFKSIGGTEVFGEWIETLSEPIYKIEVDGAYIAVDVEVDGYIREISEARSDLDITLLRNGIEKQFVTEDYHSGDDLYMMFKTPQDGYLLVYLVDASYDVYCLLPYLSSEENSYRVEGNKEYVFFSQSFADDFLRREVVDEYTMTADGAAEYNAIYVVFSPNKIIRANDVSNGELMPRMLGFEQFQAWLSTNRKRDNQLQVRKLDFIVKQ